MIFTISGCSKNREIIESPVPKTFFEKYDEIVDNPQKEFIITSNNYQIKGKIDEKNKYFLAELLDGKMNILNFILNGNILYVDVSPVYDYVKEKYPEDEMMNIMAETIQEQFAGNKYLKTNITEEGSDIWNNINAAQNNEFISGDMAPLYELYSKVFNEFNTVFRNSVSENDIVKINVDSIKDIVKNIENIIKNNEDKYSSSLIAIWQFKNLFNEEFSNISLEKVLEDLFNYDKISSDFIITITPENHLKYDFNNLKCEIWNIDLVTIPQDLDLAFDINSNVSENYSVINEIELSDGEIIESNSENTNEEFITVESDSFASKINTSNLFSLILQDKENFNSLIKDSLTPLGFEVLEETGNVLKLKYESFGRYDVIYENEKLTFELSTLDSEEISSFINEFSESALAILGISFDKYQLISKYQDAYTSALADFKNENLEHKTIGNLTIDGINIEIQFKIQKNEDNSALMSILASVQESI